MKQEIYFHANFEFVWIVCAVQHLYCKGMKLTSDGIHCCVVVSRAANCASVIEWKAEMCRISFKHGGSEHFILCTGTKPFEISKANR